jgi:DNA-binding PadR family transcriptional regulator
MHMGVEMNNSELFLLGLINQSPRYGYEIAQFLEESNASLWINISMPYVYRLLKSFESEGWVLARQVESSNRPNKNVYEITAKGRTALLSAINENDFGSDRIYFGMDVALAAFTLIEQKFDLMSLLDQKIQKIQEELEQFDLEGMSKAEDTDDAAAAILIIEHRIGFLQSELEWLKKVKTTFSERKKPLFRANV